MENPQPMKCDAVKQKIRDRLLSGALTGLLPGVRQLAREYDVNFMTVNKAINRLEQENLVYRVPRKGTFVRQQRNILVAYNDASPNFFEFEVYSSMIAAIQQEFARHNCFMIFENLYGKNEQTLQTLYSRIDGMLFFGREFPGHKRLADKPVVRTMGLLDSGGLDHVSYDNGKIGILAADYLMAQGHDRCATIGNDNTPLFAQRRQSFADRLAAKGETFLPLPWQTGAGLKHAALEQLSTLARTVPIPVGIFCLTDFEAPLTLHFLSEQGWKHGRDFHIVGCNNSSSLNSFLPGSGPASIDLRQKEIGALGAKLLLKRINGDTSDPIRKTFEPRLFTPGEIERLRNADTVGITPTPPAVLPPVAYGG